MARATRRSGSGVKIADVARRAGVSPMTVSRVVNEESNVRAGTREAVLAAVAELGYAPNLAARSLAKAQDVRIGVVHSNPSAGFLSEFLVGVLDETQRQGVQITLVRCGDGEAAELETVRRLVQGGADGVILPPPHSESSALQAALARAGLPVAVVAAGLPPKGVICVRVDDRRAAYDMARHLLDLGHRHLGVVGGHPDQTSSSERMRGIQAALDETEATRLSFAPGLFDFPSGLTAAEVLLDAPLRPTAVFALNDDMAAAVISVAHRRGLDVPRDLTVVGFDDTTLAVTLWPPLTTVRQPVRAMAGRAAELLVRRLRSVATPAGEAASVDETLPHALVERQSAAPPGAPGRPAHATARSASASSSTAASVVAQEHMKRTEPSVKR